MYLYGLGLGSAYTVQSALLIDIIVFQDRNSTFSVFTTCFNIGISVGSIGKFFSDLIKELKSNFMSFEWDSKKTF